VASKGKSDLSRGGQHTWRKKDERKGPWMDQKRRDDMFVRSKRRKERKKEKEGKKDKKRGHKSRERKSVCEREREREREKERKQNHISISKWKVASFAFEALLSSDTPTHSIHSLTHSPHCPWI